MAKKVKEKVDIFTSLAYVPADKIMPSITMLSGNKKYERYSKIDPESFCPLKLLDLMSSLGEVGEFIDYDTILGGFFRDDKGELFHAMGLYRVKQGLYESTTPEARSEHVDEITNLAAKKALETTDEEDAMRYAFIFAILRGYNLRSVIGACFAQEMSLRWIFAQKDWPQFNKMPGIYLDIEAAFRPSGEYSSGPLLQKEVMDYKTANLVSSDPHIPLGDDPIFDTPQQQKQNDFITYLMEARRYRSQDLGVLISSEISQNIFNIAARNGDVSFFKMLQKECKNDENLKRKFDDSISKISREEVVSCAMEYGGELMLLAANLAKPSTLARPLNRVSQFSPVSVDEIEVGGVF
jgi:hypothetical protein